MKTCFREEKSRLKVLNTFYINSMFTDSLVCLKINWKRSHYRNWLVVFFWI